MEMIYALLEWRVTSRAKFQGRNADTVLKGIVTAKAALGTAPWITLGSFLPAIYVKDMRGQHLPELSEASVCYGIPYLADGIPDEKGRDKVVCGGPVDVVRAFLDRAASQGLVDCYGDPEQGFAGAYCK